MGNDMSKLWIPATAYTADRNQDFSVFTEMNVLIEDGTIQLREEKTFFLNEGRAILEWRSRNKKPRPKVRAKFLHIGGQRASYNGRGEYTGIEFSVFVYDTENLRRDLETKVKVSAIVMPPTQSLAALSEKVEQWMIARANRGEGVQIR